MVAVIAHGAQMISIPGPDKHSQQKPLWKQTKFKPNAEVWTAFCMIAIERKRTPEEMLSIWVQRYIENKEKVAAEEASQENNGKIII